MGKRKIFNKLKSLFNVKDINGITVISKISTNVLINVRKEFEKNTFFFFVK